MNKLIYLLGGGLLLGLGLLLGYWLFGGATDVAHVHVTPMETASAASAATTWTCSMHPQIQQGEPGDCPLCGMDLIPLESGAHTDPAVLEMTEAAVALAAVRTTEVVPADARGADTLRLTGRLQLDEAKATTLSAHVPGRIERLFVQFEGERIEAGQRVALIYSPELVAAQRELLAARMSSAQFPALLDAARQKLRNYKIAPATIERIEASGEAVTEFPVYAETGGIVLDKRIAVGDYVRAGEALYTLTQLNSLYAAFDAYEAQLRAIRRGQSLTFTTPALPGRTFRSRVDFIDPLIDPATRTATVRATVNNPGGLLKPEMFVTAALAAAVPGPGPEAGALVVPRTAVLWTGERSVVYVALPDRAVPSYAFREVAVIEALGDNYLIGSGLEAGERVVTNGAFSLDAAAQLNNQLSMMNRDVVIQGQGEEVVVIEDPDYSDQVPAALQGQLAELVAAYLPAKTALVEDRLAAAQLHFAELLPRIQQLDGGGLPPDPLAFFEQQTRAMSTHARLAAEAADLAGCREQFSYLTQALVRLVKSFGLPPDQTFYQQYCPMAFDNAGAYWISDEETILNPYFGDAMLRCGYVENEL